MTDTAVALEFDDDLTVFGACADGTRLRVLFLLAVRELCVCELVEILQMPQGKVSRHLALLKAAGLVLDRREGLWIYYSLAPARAPLCDYLHPYLRQGLPDVPRADRARLDQLAACGAICFPRAADGSPTWRLLFLCTGNSCRSQMAEGWARHLKGASWQVMSAGVAPGRLDPRAVRVMAEVGVDISGQEAKHVDTLKDVAFDYVVTVCGGAAERCPLFPGKTRVVHRGFDDPPQLAAGAATEDEALAPYRRVRDEIRAFVAALPEGLR
jgi:arsenate reductase